MAVKKLKNVAVYLVITILDWYFCYSYPLKCLLSVMYLIFIWSVQSTRDDN